MKLDNLEKVKTVLINTKDKLGYINHEIRRQNMDNNQFIYWILIKFKTKITLYNSDVYNSIQNFLENSLSAYEEFINKNGEVFNNII